MSCFMYCFQNMPCFFSRPVKNQDMKQDMKQDMIQRKQDMKAGHGLITDVLF